MGCTHTMVGSTPPLCPMPDPPPARTHLTRSLYAAYHSLSPLQGCFVDRSNTGDLQLFWNRDGLYTPSYNREHGSVCVAVAVRTNTPSGSPSVLLSGSPSVAPTVEGGSGKCTAHADCGHNGASHTYCDVRRMLDLGLSLVRGGCVGCSICGAVSNQRVQKGPRHHEK